MTDSIARQVVDTINSHDHSAYTLQAGYLVIYPNRGTIRFPTGTTIREVRDKRTQRVKMSITEYADGSRITYRHEKGLQVHDRRKTN